MPLGDYLRNLINTEKFLNIVQSIILIIKSCDDYLLNSDNVELRPEAIFIEPKSLTIKCIYWPIVNNQSYIKPRDFFKTLVAITNFAGSESDEWLSKYNLFLNSLQPFSLQGFENLITKLQGKKVQTTDISPSSSLLNEDGSSTSLQSSSAMKDDLVYNPVSTSNSVGGDTDINIGVAIKLKRKSSNEIINVNTSVFSIGKSESDNYYAITNNAAVSRKHAEIRLKNNQYYIVDCNSTNGVKINGKKIKPAVEYKIKSGDKIHLANEEFLVE